MSNIKRPRNISIFILWILQFG